jgi:hypothetical protein
MTMNEYNRTCGSVRSSLAALAGLATTPWEAAVTMELRPSGREARREAESSEPPMSGGSSARLMACPTQVNCKQAPLSPTSQMTLTGSGQNRHAAGCSSHAWEHTDRMAAGVMQGLNHRWLRGSDELNPSHRLHEAGASARAADGAPGKGCWRKRMPPCNGADRSCNITPLREQAHFQRVVRYETTGRTNKGGNSK